MRRNTDGTVGGFAGQFVDRETGQVTQGAGVTGGMQATVAGGMQGYQNGLTIPDIRSENVAATLGHGVGAGAGLFFTNAKRVEELRGYFWTRLITTPIGSVQYDRSGNVGVISITYGPSIRGFYWSGSTTAATTRRCQQSR